MEVEVDGRRLTLSNLGKVLYPASGTTKADVVDYYRRVAPTMLPHLRRRAPTLVRAPDGPDGTVFFEKRCPGHRPPWVETAVVGREGRHEGYEGCLIDDLPALVWVANLAALELHVHQATVDAPETPTSVVLDLDPGPPADVLACCEVALELRDVLEALGLTAVVKSSGGKGLHVAVPVNAPGARADETKRFALALGRLLESRHPDRVTTDMAKTKRRGRVFVDWSQNDRHKTTIAPYSLRVGERPTVSSPLGWEEVVEAHDARDRAALVHELPDVLERLADGDRYAANLSLVQELPSR